MTIPVLHTERLVLREFRNDDLDAYSAMCGDAETMQFLGNVALDRDDTWRMMATFAGHWLLRGYGNWAVEEKATGACIGRLGLWYPEGWPGLEVGWMISRDRWGQGYAPEGARAAVTYAYDIVGTDQLITIIHPRNDKSIRVAEKLGATMRAQMELRGSPVNVYEVPRGD